MSLKDLSLVIFPILLISAIACAEENNRITGQDWLLMSREEKGAYIFTAMEVLKKDGVPLGKTPDQYTSLIDSDLVNNPNALKADVTNILASVVYENDPGAREAIDKLRK